MSVKVGPILYFDSADANSWRFTVRALVAAQSGTEAATCGLSFITDSNNDLASITVSNARLITSFEDIGARAYWIGWDVDVPRVADDREIAYRITTDAGASPDIGPVVVPRKGVIPRIAFFSCNGAGDDRKFHDLDEPYGLWTDMFRLHKAGLAEPSKDNPSAFHLLIGGGDQIYADSVWDKKPLNKYKPKNKTEKKNAKVSESFRKALGKVYLDLYCDRWSREAVATMKARVPGMFTWDDHDIFDGWGSHDDDLTDCELYSAIYDAARRAFDVFQLGGESTLVVSNHSHAMQATTLGGTGTELGILMLDTRSNRRRNQILSDAQWNDLKAWLSQFAQNSRNPRHLLIVSAVPVIYLRFHLEGTTAPMGLEDDRRDGWEHRDHRGERTRLLMTLLAHSKEAQCQTTILSGDVHVASRGRVVSKLPDHRRGDRQETVVHQLTSSAIGHPEPSMFQWLGIQMFTSDDPEVVADGVQSQTMSMLPGERYIRSRNFMTLGFDAPTPATPIRMWAQWYTEKYDNLSNQQVIVADRPMELNAS